MSENEKVFVAKLLDKSQEAFIMALETYNKPTIQYRVEGFSFFICNAWELMLKAQMIVTKGYDSIFFGDSPNRSISLEKCIAAIFTNKKDPLRKNLEAVCSLRNQATHLIVEEYEQIYAPLFQACVNNYDEKLFEFHQINISNKVPSSFLVLSMNANPLQAEVIRAKYLPEVAEQILFDENRVFQDMLLEESTRYAVTVRTEISIVKNPKHADMTVAIDSFSDAKVRIAKEFKDPANTHPYSVGKIVNYVNKSLKKQGIDLLFKGEKKEFNTSDWNLFCKFYNFKNDPDYGYCHEVGTSKNYKPYTYSQRTIDLIVSEIKESPKNIIESLKEATKKKESGVAPGAKDSKLSPTPIREPSTDPSQASPDECSVTRNDGGAAK